MKRETGHPWEDKISNHHQLGGIETSVLDNGAGRGVRIAWLDTGSGLRYKVVIDRAMDIAGAFYKQHSLAWISHTGITPPDPSSNTGIQWLRSFGGGLLTTCGLSHTGGPESDESEKRGLHGRISNLPAEVECVIQPEIHLDKPEMSITGITRETSIFGPRLEMKRTISSVLGRSSIKIHDEVRNCGNEPAPHMLLYHCNFGWPLVDEGTNILWRGEWESRGSDDDNHIFNNENNFKKCTATLPEHSGAGEAAAFIDIKRDANGECFCGLYNSSLNIALILKFRKDQLPCLTNWQHWGKGEYVTALEPGTHWPVGQNRARETGTLIEIEPGRAQHYDLEFEIIEEKEKMDSIIEKINE